jgi:hypothetical protein
MTVSMRTKEEANYETNVPHLKVVSVNENTEINTLIFNNLQLEKSVELAQHDTYLARVALTTYVDELTVQKQYINVLRAHINDIMNDKNFTSKGKLKRIESLINEFPMGSVSDHA